MMPPAGRPRPDGRTYDGFREWIEGELDPGRRGRSRARPRAHPPPEPRRVRERGAGSAGARDRRRRPAACRRHRPRVRQPRGHARAVAGIDGALPLGGAADQPPRGRRPDNRAGLYVAGLRRPDRDDPERPDERGPAVRFPRRPRGPPPLSARRRVPRHDPAEAQRLRVHREPRRGARPRLADRRPARRAVHRRRGRRRASPRRSPFRGPSWPPGESEFPSQDWDDYRTGADADLVVRVPVRAGTRVVGASFVGKSWEQEGVLQPPLREYGATVTETTDTSPRPEGPGGGERRHRRAVRRHRTG